MGKHLSDEIHDILDTLTYHERGGFGIDPGETDLLELAGRIAWELWKRGYPESLED